jgi:hypothetical protein
MDNFVRCSLRPSASEELCMGPYMVFCVSGFPRRYRDPTVGTFLRCSGFGRH